MQTLVTEELLKADAEKCVGVEQEKRRFGKKLFLYGKRIFDITSSVLGMIVAIPIFIIIAILIKKEDGGPIFYKHRRVGLNGKTFDLYKFRTMSVGADNLLESLSVEQLENFKKEFKLEDDPRITKIGNVLRRSSLDELPQLINILRGEMSLVGPRPLVQDELANYGINQEKLLSIKPGLTGYWQAYARNNVSYESGERQKMEMYYVEHVSLWLDIKILFKTVETVIKKEGAK